MLRFCIRSLWDLESTVEMLNIQPKFCTTQPSWQLDIIRPTQYILSGTRIYERRKRGRRQREIRRRSRQRWRRRRRKRKKKQEEDKTQSKERGKEDKHEGERGGGGEEDLFTKEGRGGEAGGGKDKDKEGEVDIGEDQGGGGGEEEEPESVELNKMLWVENFCYYENLVSIIAVVNFLVVSFLTGKYAFFPHICSQETVYNLRLSFCGHPREKSG